MTDSHFCEETAGGTGNSLPMLRSNKRRGQHTGRYAASLIMLPEFDRHTPLPSHSRMRNTPPAWLKVNGAPVCSPV